MLGKGVPEQKGLNICFSAVVTVTEVDPCTGVFTVKTGGRFVSEEGSKLLFYYEIGLMGVLM